MEKKKGSRPEKLCDSVHLLPGDCLFHLDKIDENSVDSCVTDPPYHLTSIVKRFGASTAKPVRVGNINATNDLKAAHARLAKGFMGKEWDGGDVAFQKTTWAKVFRVLKPGAHLVAFCGTRNYHRLACAIEDAGFEIRDSVMWLYGSGFPKSHDVSKGIDKAAGAERKRIKVPVAAPNDNIYGEYSGEIDSYEAVTDEAKKWQGWGTALKPAAEIICLARKPLSEKSVAANVLKWGTGAINIDGCRVEGYEREPKIIDDRKNGNTWHEGATGLRNKYLNKGAVGRWPANIAHDGSTEVLEGFPDSKSCNTPSNAKPEGRIFVGARSQGTIYPGEDGSAARFFYTAKADADERIGTDHPTVKPVDLMQWLVRMVTPPKGRVLDPFAGTGTTGEAAHREKRKAILIEKEPAYQQAIRDRVQIMQSGQYAREVAKMKRKKPALGALFAGKSRAEP